MLKIEYIDFNKNAEQVHFFFVMTRCCWRYEADNVTKIIRQSEVESVYPNTKN